MGSKKVRGSAKGHANKQPSLTVHVVPTKGTATNHKVKIPKDGLTAKQVCEQLKIPANKKNLYLNGVLIGLDDVITAKLVLEVKDKQPAQQLRVEERSQGS